VWFDRRAGAAGQAHVAIAAVKLHDRPISKGEVVVPMFDIANRDPDVFPGRSLNGNAGHSEFVTRTAPPRAAIAFGSPCRHPDSRALIHPPVLIGPCVTGVETAESRKSSRR
jgi:hypothetical protein